MAEIIKSGDIDLLNGKVAVLGYGSQGHAHALNLHDSGVEVEVGLRPDSSSRAAAEEAGLTVRSVADAVRDAQLVAFLVPDGAQPALYEQEVAPNLAPGAALLFAHGFNVHYGRIAPPAGHDVIMVAPKGPGPHRAALLRRGLRDAGRCRGRAGCERARARARARLRRRARRGARGNGRDDVPGGDRDRPLRRADGALRRRHAADPARLRDARRGRATSPRSPTTSACTS